MFTKSHLALVIGAVLATPAVAEVQTDEHVVVEGREFGYKADTNSTAMRMFSGCGSPIVTCVT